MHHVHAAVMLNRHDPMISKGQRVLFAFIIFLQPKVLGKGCPNCRCLLHGDFFGKEAVATVPQLPRIFPKKSTGVAAYRSLEDWVRRWRAIVVVVVDVSSPSLVSITTNLCTIHFAWFPRSVACFWSHPSCSAGALQYMDSLACEF